VSIIFLACKKPFLFYTITAGLSKGVMREVGDENQKTFTPFIKPGRATGFAVSP